LCEFLIEDSTHLVTIISVPNN